MGMSIYASKLIPIELGYFEKTNDVDLSVVSNNTPAIITKKAIELLGGMGKFVKKGNIVVVKPNIGWARHEKEACNTNPEVVATLVKMCYEAGAKKVKVFDRPCNEARRSYKDSGIKDAVEKVDGEIKFIDERKWVNTKVNGEELKEWLIYEEALNCDSFINVPIAKHHSSTGLTLGMKNLMGVCGGDRGDFHRRGLDKCIPDINQKVKVHLTVIDAVRILTRHGPASGRLSDVKELKTVIASADTIAADSYASTLFGLIGKDIGHIQEGHKRGLGEIDLKKVKISKVDLGSDEQVAPR